MSGLRAWFLAVRPRTLLAAAAPVVVGTAAAAGAGAFKPVTALACLAGAGLLQVGANLANDVFDHERGADGPDRLGPTRVVAAGLLSPRAVKVAMALVFAAALLVGTFLVKEGGWPIVLVGLAGILSGIAYTGGPWPLGYHGLGDVFVFIFFGLVAVSGTFYVQAGTVTWPVVAAGAGVGLLATAILAVNNIRDIDTDARAGKRTIAVRLGRERTRVYYTLLLVGAYAIVAGIGAVTRDPLALLPLVTAPLAVKLARTVATRTDGPSLNDALAGTARLLGLASLLLAPSWIF